MNEVTKQINEWFPRNSGISEQGELNAGLNYDVEIITLSPYDILYYTGKKSAYNVEIVTHAVLPNFTERLVVLRTIISNRLSSFDERLCQRCWNIYDDIGENNYNLTGLNGYMGVYKVVNEKALMSQNAKMPLLQMIKRMETLTKEYRRRLEYMGYDT